MNENNTTNTPYIAVGNEEIEAMPELGETVKCWICGKDHKVEFGKKVLKDGTRVPFKKLAFFKCKDKTYLCGINGKEWRPADK